MKKELKMTKGTAFILILVLVSSVVLGVGIKDRLSQQGVDDNYIAPTPTPESASVWDAFDDEEPDAGNESVESGEQDIGEGESLPPAEPELEWARTRSSCTRISWISSFRNTPGAGAPC